MSAMALLEVDSLVVEKVWFKIINGNEFIICKIYEKKRAIDVTD